ncbi:hypothetical protein D3C81_1013150 [compost metagenome]
MWQRFEAFVGLGYADHRQQLQGALSGRLAAQALVQQEDLVDLLFDVVQRVERSHRLLEDHRHAVAANAPHLFLVEGQQVVTLEQDAAARVPGQGVGQQAQDRVRCHRLARTAFADQGQGFAAADVEADAFDHPLALIAGDELDGQVADFDQGFLAHLISSGRRHRGRTRR